MPKARFLHKSLVGRLNAYFFRTVQKQLLSTFLTLCLCGGGVALAIDEPGVPQSVQGPADATARRVAAGTIASIAALGANPATKQISSIVFKAVRSSPDNVLVIVDAASRVSPLSAVPEIVTAATAAVPNPWKQVAYHRLHGKSSGPDYNGGPDGKQARDGGKNMDLGGREPGATAGRGTSGRSAGDPGSNASGGNGVAIGSIFWNSGTFGTGGADPFVFDPSQAGNAVNGSTMTLAEAIAITAFQAQPGLSFSSLRAAVDIALRTDPAVLLGNILGSRSVSGVGDAGLSNYANEPLRTPKQPAVSR